MTPAFGGQYSIQLSYGRFVGRVFYRLKPDCGTLIRHTTDPHHYIRHVREEQYDSESP